MSGLFRKYSALSVMNMWEPMFGATKLPRILTTGPSKKAQPAAVRSPLKKAAPREVKAATLMAPDCGLPLLKSEVQSNPFNRIALVALAALRAVTALTPVQTTPVPL